VGYLLAGILSATCCLPASGQVNAANPMIRRRIVRPVPAGSISLPNVQQDGSGNQWMIYGGGWCRINGPQTIVMQGEMLTINGMQPNMNANGMGNFAQIDAKTGEIILDNMNAGDVTVSRRILVSKTDASIRYFDIFKNSQNQEATVNATYQSAASFGISNAMIVRDPKRAELQYGWVGQTVAGQAVVELYAGKGVKNGIPAINYQQGSNQVQADIQIKIPAGKSVAILHELAVEPTFEAGQQFIAAADESKITRSLPPNVRKLMVNFVQGVQDIGDLEILRGDALDVVELRGGDQIKGTIKEDSYKLATFYGPVELSPDKVIAILNVGQIRPRQLLVTADGQIFGGKLEKDSLALQLSSGQVTQIPLAQITRAGYRHQPSDQDEWKFTDPMVQMRTGERMKVQMPDAPLQVYTRYGTLSLDPHSVSSIAFQSEDNAVHHICLTDGTHLAGLVDGQEFDMKLVDGGGAGPVKFPAADISRWQLAASPAEIDESTPTLNLTNQDLMVGTLVGLLKLDTAFDTLQINAPEIRRISHAQPDSPDVQVTLWDNTTVSGQFEEQQLQCHLLSGADVNVPLSLLGEYNQPYPQPSPGAIEKIKDDVKQLSADDYQQRQHAEADLVATGSSVIGTLKELRASQPPEAQARIDAIIKQLGTGG
jgi:hypothetical protein